MAIEYVTQFPKRPKTHEFILDSGYMSQLDNWTKYHGAGNRQCRLTSYCNVFDYVLDGELTRRAEAKGYWEPEDYYGELIKPYGDTTETYPHSKAAQLLGIEGYFTATACVEDVAHSLYLGVPVPAGFYYKVSGHWGAFVGRYANGFFVDDPYGTRQGSSNVYSVGKGGDNDNYSYNLLNQVFDRHNGAGYAFFITAVNGKPTGVKRGM